MDNTTGTWEQGNSHAGSGRSGGTRNRLSRLRDCATARLRDQRGSALATVLVLIVLLTVAGVVMVNSTLTETSIAYNQSDSAAAQYAAEAGLSRAMYELSQNAGWTGTTAAIGDAQYVVAVATSGSVRAITSTGTRGGGRRVLKAAVAAIPQSASATVLANATATIGSGTTGVTVSNNFPSSAASAVQANNKLAAGTAMTVNTTGANIIGGLTANGTISGVTCATWAWTCNASAVVRSIPEIDVDSTASTSLKYRAQHSFDADGKYLYFKGGDAGRCNSGGAWTFASTQQCWDYYVNSKSGTIGSGISNPVFFVEFTASESTNYTTSGGGGVAYRNAANDGYNGLGLGNCVHVPSGVVDGDVMIAGISWSDGTSETISAPANYAMNMTNSDLPGGADFTKELGDYITDVSLTVSVAPNATEDSFAFTKAGVPGAAGVTGDYYTTNYVPSAGANSNIMLSVAVARVNSSGVQQGPGSSFSAELAMGVGQKSFTLTGVNLGTWSAGDRLKVIYRFRNTVGTTQSVTIGPGIAGNGNYNMVKTPWSNGWTLVRRIDNGTRAGLAIYWKVASNETGRVCRSYTGAGYDWAFTPGSGSQSMAGAIVAYSGVDTASPINAENGQATASSSTHSTPSITTTVANAMVVASFAVGAATGISNQWTPPAGMTERVDRGAQAVALGMDEQLQASAGATGVKTATAAKSGSGATHILALKPGGGGVTVNCTGYSSALETLCIRATAASPYPNSVLTQVTGAIVAFRCTLATPPCYGNGSSASVKGDIAFENIGLASANYTHSGLTGDPALVAGGQVMMSSSGTPPGRTKTNITGIIYTFAGTENPSSGNLQGVSATGVTVQHGADTISVTLSGFVMSNGSITLQDTGGTGNSVTVRYDSTVANNLPAAFTASSGNYILIPISWSSGD